MPTKKINPQPSIPNTQSRLSDWLFKWPMRFSLSLIGLGLLAVLLGTMVASAFGGVVGYIFLLVSAFSIIGYLIWRGIRRAGPAPFSRKDMMYKMFGGTFVAVLAVSMIILLFISIMTIASSGVTESPGLGYLVILLSVLMMLTLYHLIGLLLFSYIATYKYARANNLPKWKYWLSFPFGLFFFDFVPFVAESNKKVADSVTNKTRWFENLVTWVIKTPKHGWIAIIVLMVVSMFLSIPTTVADFVYITPFILMVVGLYVFAKKYTYKKLTKEFPGILGSAGIFFNVLVICGMILSFNITIHQMTQKHMVTMPTIEITEIIEIYGAAE